MKLINCNENQQKLLQDLHPEHARSQMIAIVPAGEYYFWLRSFTHLLDSLSGYFSSLKLSLITQLPVIQCVSKFVGINEEGYLCPKTYKFHALPDGNLRDFGYSQHMGDWVGSVVNNTQYPQLRISEKATPDLNRILGFLAWDEQHPPIRGAKHLMQFIKCANRIEDVKLVNDRLMYDGKYYDYFLPTYRYYPNPLFQKKLLELRKHRRLLIPAEYPLSNLKNFIGFQNPTWAEVKSLEFFLEEAPENLHQYVLIRVDDGKIITWDKAIADPKLRLEIEMSDYWLWQEACPTTESLQDINMYWEFGTDYPWLLDKRTGLNIPVYIVD
jgi:hypothetical protein